MPCWAISPNDSATARSCAWAKRRICKLKPSPPARWRSIWRWASAASRAAASPKSTGRNRPARRRCASTSSPRRRSAAASRAYIDMEHALDPTYAARCGVNVDNLYISQPDTGEQALEIAEQLVRLRRGGRDRDRLGGRARAARRDRRRDGRQPHGSAGPLDVPGPAETLRRDQAVQHRDDLHQSTAHEDRRDVRQSRNDDGRQRA